MPSTRVLRRRLCRDPVLVLVVDPYAPAARAWVPALRELTLRVDVPVEVVCTGDRAGQEDSLHAAAGIIALLAPEAVHPVTVVEDVLRAHADRGQDIADLGVVAELAAARRLDTDAVKLMAASDHALAMAREDREIARRLGDPGDVALLHHGGGGRWRRLPGPPATGRELVAAWGALTR